MNTSTPDNNTIPTRRRRRGIAGWFDALARVFRREWTIVLSDVGVMIFFIVLPLAYPVTYTLIYNPEIVTEMPIAVVDNSRTPSSRQLVQTTATSPSISIYAQCADMNEAKDLFARNKVFAIMEIPYDYDKRVGRGEQAVVPMYFEMSLLLRYRAFVSAISDIQIKLVEEITATRLEAVGASTLGISGMPVESHNTFLGDRGQGFASFVMPGVLILILQQSLILGICMLRGTSNERRRRNGGIDPLQIHDAPVSARMWGKLLCYFVLYIPLVIYVVKCLPEMFALPHVGSAVDYLLFLVPFMIASGMFGFLMSNFCTERESGFLVVVFTSLIFLFLSGLTWPRYAMTPFFRLLGDLVPATWGVEGFIRINSNGATLGEVGNCYTSLWILAAVYFLVAWGIQVYVNRSVRPQLQPESAK